MKHEKIQVEQIVLHNIEDFIRNSSVDSLIQYLKDITADCKTQEITSLFFKREWGYEHEYFSVVGLRPETDKEFAQRLKRLEKEQADLEKLNKKQDKKERQEYLRLKKKFANET